MKESICEEKIIEGELNKYINIKKYYISHFIFTGIYTKHFMKKLVYIKQEDKLIKVFDKGLYEPMKRFGEENGYKKLVKCWDGVV